jgi:hypothetical protein
MANINDFKAAFNGGVRPNLFQVTFGGAGAPSTLVNTQMLVKATSLPGQTVPAFDVPYRGRQLKVAGDRTYDDWTVTFLNDAGWRNRDAMERWMHDISSYTINSSSIPFRQNYGTANVTQLNRQGHPLRAYRMDVLPTTLNAIEVDSSTNDSVEEFEVTFAVNWIMPHGQGTDGPQSSTGVRVRGSVTVEGEHGALTIGTDGFSANFGGSNR